MPKNLQVVELEFERAGALSERQAGCPWSVPSVVGILGPVEIISGNQTEEAIYDQLISI